MTQRNALHYSCRAEMYLISHLLTPHVDINAVDIYGYPPDYYDLCFRVNGRKLFRPRTNETILRVNIAHKSKKLFRFLFCNGPPTTNPMILTLKDFNLMSADQKRSVLSNIKDLKGNTLLHIMVKLDHYQFVDEIIKFNPQETLRKNLKGKVPFSYCKSCYTMDLFGDYFNSITKNVYHSMRRPVLSTFPELLELVNDNEMHTLHRMEEIAKLGNTIIRHFGELAFKKICTRATDPQYIVACMCEKQCKYFILRRIIPIYG
ncbi:hypothetical protein TNCT_356791 [Trichonephila clavata]|uniref:Uncharacterized protein n=1 Tax=Trichonephila clavata TaxID=2740835 RepID=A0A8X6GCP7_TRICU|nr:hypothetical protein TNCT_356791 [Trichonephila clavata]